MVQGSLSDIDALLAELRKTRDKLNADIAALERTRALLSGKSPGASPQRMPLKRFIAQAGAPPSGKKTLVYSPARSGLVPPAPPPSSASTGGSAWQSVAIKLLGDRNPHSTAEIFEAVEASPAGKDVGYAAVASWLLRAYHTGVLEKHGRGKYRLRRHMVIKDIRDEQASNDESASEEDEGPTEESSEDEESEDEESEDEEESSDNDGEDEVSDELEEAEES